MIQKFKSDNYNVLVSTSIGEEGLDIGEVDLIICYDSQTSPIRMVKKKVKYTSISPTKQLYSCNVWVEQVVKDVVNVSYS